MKDKPENPQWIEVKIETPKKEQEVIIYFKNVVGWHTVTCYWNGRNFIDLCEVCGHNSTYHHDTPVTHWMPLPKPPQEMTDAMLAERSKSDE